MVKPVQGNTISFTEGYRKAAWQSNLKGSQTAPAQQ